MFVVDTVVFAVDDVVVVFDVVFDGLTLFEEGDEETTVDFCCSLMVVIVSFTEMILSISQFGQGGIIHDSLLSSSSVEVVTSSPTISSFVMSHPVVIVERLRRAYAIKRLTSDSPDDGMVSEDISSDVLLLFLSVSSGKLMVSLVVSLIAFPSL